MNYYLTFTKKTSETRFLITENYLKQKQISVLRKHMIKLSVEMLTVGGWR